MPTITVKNIPENAYKSLKAMAAAHHRSVNGEIVHLIEKATRSDLIDHGAQLLIAQQLREKTKKYPITDAAITSAKNEGRP